MTGTKKCVICKLVALLAGLGALNWGLMAVAGIDLVAKLFGVMTPAAKVVYGLVGLSGILLLLSLFKCCPCQKTESGCCPTK